MAEPQDPPGEQAANSVGTCPATVKVTDELETLKEGLSQRWLTVFLGQKTPVWPDREGLNDALIATMDRLEAAREQYYKERLQIDCLERLCEALKIQPALTYADHSVTSGYLHHLQSSMAQLGIEELSLNDLECKRRQTFSGLGDKTTSLQRAGQRSRRRFAKGSTSGSSVHNSRTSLNGPPAHTLANTRSIKSCSEEKGLSQMNKESTGEARKLSITNYFGRARRSSEDHRKLNSIGDLKVKPPTSSNRKIVNQSPSGSSVGSAGTVQNSRRSSYEYEFAAETPEVRSESASQHSSGTNSPVTAGPSNSDVCVRVNAIKEDAEGERRVTAPQEGARVRLCTSSPLSLRADSDERDRFAVRANTLTRRNRIMSLRRRNEGDSSSSITTAEAVGDGDFRRMAMSGFVDGEKLYHNTLRTVFFNYYKPLKALASSSQPICSEQEVNVIFHNVCDLYTLHTSLGSSLDPLIESEFEMLDTLPNIFRTVMSKAGLYRSYMANFSSAIETVGRLRSESPAFQAFLDKAAEIKVKGRRSEPIEEMLRTPMVRLENYQAVLSDLCASESAEDSRKSSLDVAALHNVLVLLTQEVAKISAQPKNHHFERKLVMTGLCVELHENKRKFRHVCLFNDVLICATRTRLKSKHPQQKPHDCKWFLPLDELSWHPPDVTMDPILPVAPTSASDMKECQHKINKLKGDIKHSEQSKKKFGLKNDKERKRKNLQELEFVFKMMHYNQVVRFFSKSGKVHTLLFVENSEKAEWMDAIEICQRDLMRGPRPDQISAVDIQQILFSLRSELQKHEEEVKAFMEDDDVELLDGLLVVLVDCAYGLKSKGKADVFIQLEVDTYGRLERKAKTKQVPYCVKPEWDQGFEVELEAAHSMNVQIYESRMLSYSLIAKGVFELVNKGILDQEIHTIDLPLQPQGQLSMKLQYLTPERMVKRSVMMKANTTTAVFGVPIEFVSLRDGDLVPNIVRLCAEEVEERGVEETGVYRISGLASDVKMLREAFDTDIEQASALVKTVDIHAVTGALKLFLREMPEPLFPRILYNRFVEGTKLSNSDSRVNCMISLLYSLPDTNLLTTLYLIKHFKTVSNGCGCNKMTTSNLATVIGPNVLKPVDDGSERIVLDIANQVAVLGFFLDLPDEELEPDERDTDSQGVVQSGSVTSMGRLAKMQPSRSNDSISATSMHSFNRDLDRAISPSAAALRKGYLDIHNKT